jgi:O-acetyl-ADP-ribose deacetylase (regulator of RNase III)
VIKHITGDLFKIAAETKSPIAIAHGCNCFHAMGAGVARRVALLYPEALEADRATPHGAVSQTKLGSISYVRVNPNLMVINAYTQFYPGADFRLDAFRSAMLAIRELTQRPLFIPKIGAGIGGGSWPEIQAVLEQVFEYRDVTVVSLAGG